MMRSGECIITKLTEREKDVLKLLISGMDNSEIADKLFVSTHTIKAHLENIYEKFSVNNRVQAVVYALKNDIINF